MTYTTEELRKKFKESYKGTSYDFNYDGDLDAISNFWLKHLEDYKALLKSDMLRIIADECIIARQEGVATSRLTATANKLLALLE